MGSPTYRVWVEVEEVNEDEDTCETVLLPVLAGVFETYDEADQFVIQATGFSTKENND